MHPLPNLRGEWHRDGSIHLSWDYSSMENDKYVNVVYRALNQQKYESTNLQTPGSRQGHGQFVFRFPRARKNLDWLDVIAFSDMVQLGVGTVLPNDPEYQTNILIGEANVQYSVRNKKIGDWQSVRFRIRSDMDIPMNYRLLGYRIGSEAPRPLPLSVPKGKIETPAILVPTGYDVSLQLMDNFSADNIHLVRKR